MDRVRNLINCDGIHRLGYTGRGVGVAILDTGDAAILLSSLTDYTLLPAAVIILFVLV